MCQGCKISPCLSQFSLPLLNVNDFDPMRSTHSPKSIVSRFSSSRLEGTENSSLGTKKENKEKKRVTFGNDKVYIANNGSNRDKLK